MTPPWSFGVMDRALWIVQAGQHGESEDDYETNHDFGHTEHISPQI